MRLVNVDAQIEMLSKQLEDEDISEAAADWNLMMINELKAMPTDYDVDKVVERLEEKAKAYDDPASSDEGFRRYCRGIAVGYRYAVDIVKAEFERCGKPESEG